jgi:hypothetical protein
MPVISAVVIRIGSAGGPDDLGADTRSGKGSRLTPLSAPIVSPIVSQTVEDVVKSHQWRRKHAAKEVPARARIPRRPRSSQRPGLG